jgi:hypothetical protein
MNKNYLVACLVVFVILVGSAVYYFHTHLQPAPITTNSVATVSSKPTQLTKNDVLNGYDFCGQKFVNGDVSIGWDAYQKLEDQRFVKGVDSNCNAGESIDNGSTSPQIIFTDLDNDGVQEALAPVRVVRASSGGELWVFKNIHGVAQAVDQVSFGKGNANVVSATGNTVIVQSDDGFGTNKTTTYLFLNGHLTEQN